MGNAILVKSGYNESNTKTITRNNVKVPVSSWAEDKTGDNYRFESYPYKADITVEGITTEYLPNVIFGMNEAISGKFAPICESGAGIVSIWAQEIPTSEITIATISATLEVV